MHGAKASCFASVALVAVAVAGLGCSPRPSAESCDAMVEHLIELTRGAHEGRAAEIAGQVFEAHRESLRTRCLDDGTPREVACVIAATSLDDIPACAPK